jgi:hypothetical protein
MEAKTYTLPSGIQVGFRESNANDEGILTTQGFREAHTHIARYLAAVCNFYNGKSGRLTLEEVNKWGLADKYYALVLSRVFNFGTELTFNWTFEGEEVPVGMIVDLNDYLLADDRLDGIKEDGKYAPKPYPNGTQKEFLFATTSGKEFKWYLIDSNAEIAVANKDLQTINSLDLFKTRKLTWNANGQGDWIKLEDFSIISSREAREIRSHIRKNDVSFDMGVDITHPTNKSKSVYVPLPGIPDFLEPSEI